MYEVQEPDCSQDRQLSDEQDVAMDMLLEDRGLSQKQSIAPSGHLPCCLSGASRSFS